VSSGTVVYNYHRIYANKIIHLPNKGKLVKTSAPFSTVVGLVKRQFVLKVTGL
jgi:hypothetical protein